MKRKICIFVILLAALVILFVIVRKGMSGGADASDDSVMNQENVLSVSEETQEDSEPSEAVSEESQENSEQSDAVSEETQENSEQSDAVSESWSLHYIDAWGEWHDAQIDPAANMHAYDWDCLQNDGQNISYSGDGYEIRKGVDVSHHQGTIDWAKVKADGYDFAILRIAYRGYGESGNLMPDEMFSQNYSEARAAGLDVGVYIFSQAVNETETAEEAQYVLELLDEKELQLPVVFDPESIRDDEARTDSVSGEQFTKNAIVFCDAINAAGYEPMIYSNMVWEDEFFDMRQLSAYSFWYADYEPEPQTPYAFTFWQYSNEGNVDGIEGTVDLDVQFLKTDE